MPVLLRLRFRNAHSAVEAERLSSHNESWALWENESTRDSWLITMKITLQTSRRFYRDREERLREREQLDRERERLREKERELQREKDHKELLEKLLKSNTNNNNNQPVAAISAVTVPPSVVPATSAAPIQSQIQPPPINHQAEPQSLQHYGTDSAGLGGSNWLSESDGVNNEIFASTNLGGGVYE